MEWQNSSFWLSPFKVGLLNSVFVLKVFIENFLKFSLLLLRVAGVSYGSLAAPDSDARSNLLPSG